MPRLLIVNADDLGISIPTNLAIRDGFQRGIVTSASLMTNMPHFRHAVEQVAQPNPGLGIGVHLTLTSGRPVSRPEEVPLLLDGEGRFRWGFVGLWRLLRSRRGEEARRQIQRELETQLVRAEQAGVVPDHVDSHQHVHFIPEILGAVASLARTRRLPVRRIAEPLGPVSLWPRRLAGSLVNGGWIKWLLLERLSRRMLRECPDLVVTRRSFGVLDTGRMTLETLRRLLPLLPDGATEINLHPGGVLERCDGLECSRADRVFLAQTRRAGEFEAAVAPSLRAELTRAGIQLARFTDLHVGRFLQSTARAG